MSVKELLRFSTHSETYASMTTRFWSLHHFRERNHKEPIASLLDYCEKQLGENSIFKSNNTNVLERLEFVLKTYRDLGLSPGQTKVFVSLAEASYFAIPKR